MAAVATEDQVRDRVVLNDEERRLKWLFRAQNEAWNNLRKVPAAKTVPPSLAPAAGDRPQYEIVTDELVKEWLVKEPSLPTRLFLAERVLPTLVLGLEKLLVEVGRKGLVDTTEQQDNFNPVNYLAQFMMRHNPNFVRQTRSSQYTDRLKDVADKLRQAAMGVDEAKEERVKALLLAKKQQKERELAAKAAEEARRRELMMDVGQVWDSDGGIPALQVSDPNHTHH